MISTIPTHAQPPKKATFVVTTDLDAHDVNPGDGICDAFAIGDRCTLRAAIEEANLAADPAIIRFAMEGSTTVNLVNGPLEIDKEMVIQGDGMDATFIVAMNNSRAFDVAIDPAETVRITGMMIAGR